MLKERIGVLNDGVEVFDRPRSHLLDDDTLKRLTQEALLNIDVDVDAVVKEYTYDFGREVGETAVVETSSDDEVFYGIRKNRKGHSRFVRGKKGVPTSKVTVVLMKNTKDDEFYYILITSFFGDKTPREPWDQYADPDSRPFWDTHAYIFEKAEVRENSISKECPW